MHGSVLIERVVRQTVISNTHQRYITLVTMGSQKGDSQADSSYIQAQAGGSHAGNSQAGGSQPGSSFGAGAPRRQFRPMDAIVVNRVALTEEEKAARKARGFSENYMGDYTNENNMSADIPDELNCSLYITGLPLDVTVRDIFDDIRDIGKVFSLHVSPRRESNTKRAAAVVFFTRIAAGKIFPPFALSSSFRH